MRIHKTITVTETREHKELVSQTCDICGTVSETRSKRLWGNDGFYFDEITVTVHKKDGYNCADGGSGQELTIDICPECFEKKLIPWVESFGLAKIQGQEWEW